MNITTAINRRDHMLKSAWSYPNEMGSALRAMGGALGETVSEKIIESNATSYSHMVANSLTDADLYVVSNTIQPLVVRGAKTLPDQSVIEVTDLHTPNGMLMIEDGPEIGNWVADTGVKFTHKGKERGPVFPNGQDIPINLFSMSWHDAWEWDVHDAHLPRDRRRRYDMLYAFVYGCSDVMFPGCEATHNVVGAAPIAIVRYRYGEPFERETWVDISQGAFDDNAPRCASAPQYMKKVNSEIAVEYCAAYLFSVLLFMNQKILVEKKHKSPRAMRRSYARDPKSRPPPPKTVRVIELREYRARKPSEPGTTQVEWSCQWLVEGFWRKQWYPSKRIHKPKWIASYVKGPPDKPFKSPDDRVFHVKR